MHYFCYISQGKVDHLLSAFEEGNRVEWTETTQASTDKGGSVTLFPGLASILKGDVSYGRSDMFQKNATLKRTYTDKLRTVLAGLSPEIQPFAWSVPPFVTPARYYFLEAPFTVASLDSSALIATVEARLGDATLLLDCSLKYFSDEPVEDGRVRITSTNYRFFKDRFAITFSTVFHLTQISAGRHYGSPLYLLLEPMDNLVL